MHGPDLRRHADPRPGTAAAHAGAAPPGAIAGRTEGGPRRWVAPVVVLGCLLVLVSGGAAITDAAVERTEAHAVEAAFDRARVLARLLQAEWTDTVARIDSVQRLARLLALANLADDRSVQATLRDELTPAMAMIMPTMIEVGAVGPRGIAMWSTLRLPDQPLDLSDRDYVQAIGQWHMDRYISRPAFGVLSQHQSIHFANAVRAPNGNLLAITVVSLDTAQINALARGLEPRGQNFVAVLRSDGVVLAQSDGRGIGADLSQNLPWLQHPLTEEYSQSKVTSHVDGVTHFMVWRAVPGSDTAVVVALDEAEALAPARAIKAAVWRWNLLADIGLAVLAGLILRLLHQARRAREERIRHAGYRAQETLLRQIADEAIDLIALLDATHRFLYVNPACRRLIGAEPDTLLGVSAIDCVAPEHRAELQAVLETLTVGASRDACSCRWSIVATGCRGGWRSRPAISSCRQIRPRAGTAASSSPAM